RADGTFSREDFSYDEVRDVYTCPAGKTLTTTGHVSTDHARRYLASVPECRACPLKPKCCPNMPARRIVRDVNEAPRDVARALAKTEAFAQSRRDRKKVEMLFAHLKRILRLARLRLRGIALPDVAVPLATYAGWNFRNPSTGAPDNLLALMGSYIPFPLTRVARERDHDPRLSIEERYGSRGRYQALVTDRAAKLASEGYLLREDIETVVARALAPWDALAKGTPLPAAPS